MKPQHIEDIYEIGEILGKGGFSIVKKARKRDTGEYFALKIVSKHDKTKEELIILQREIDIMKKLSHPNIITLDDVFEEADTIYLVLELYVFCGVSFCWWHRVMKSLLFFFPGCVNKDYQR
eukprot:TRINITY_DN2266_c0_g1_i10.p2 TRINITY_DN2266_c0_g1~~TRINITY_DN2266_c0_g1_i10.p2  ORF type:complete len:121 (-),score=27.08 TRINITY_DN2266_c0_g1_i10:885-1247(-)